MAAERIRSNAPNLSAQFAQMAKELRSEYYAAITLCAERLAQTLSNSQRTSVIFILRSQGLVKTAADIQMMVCGLTCGHMLLFMQSSQHLLLPLFLPCHAVLAPLSYLLSQGPAIHPRPAVSSCQALECANIFGPLHKLPVLSQPVPCFSAPDTPAAPAVLCATPCCS